MTKITPKNNMLDKYNMLVERCNKYGFLPLISKNKMENAVKLDDISDKALTENVGDLIPHQKNWWNTHANWTKNLTALPINNKNNTTENLEEEIPLPRATI